MEHYFTQHQASPLRLRKISERIRGKEITIFLASGVFSSKRIDKGSRLLAEKAIIEDGWRVLDLGCGSGVIGIVIAKCYPKAKVVMVDINQRAVDTAIMNAKLNKLDNCEIILSNGFENVNGQFDAILFNPPQTAGKKLCFYLITQSKAKLKPGGVLQLVARHNKGGKSLYNFMQEVFGNAQALAKSGGYRVYLSKNG
ncbi:hypothetical protein DRJ48_01595 [Candidatus Woesearchaeota archaeon]|nr:methyltransferase [Candidatus Woesearchaeota archaeon]RLE43181.1 MAG: hypothetical protein DRJ48_01595 [Candidatus Woesearchaeota archaeon]